jgi:hypothetical protein
MQNDDWAYYQNIQNFLSGNFFLIPKTAPTFYTIGILATIWSLILGITSLPLLTLAVSVANFYLFSKILETKFKLSWYSNICISLILFTNFIHAYSSIGFMTENYLIFFLLLSILFFEKFQISSKLINLHISNIFSVLTFFVKQSGLIFLCATTFYFLIKRDFKNLKIQFSYLLGTALFYFFVFPKTSEMVKKNFVLDNLTRPDYIYSLVYGILLYLALFTLPLIISFIISSALEFQSQCKKILLILFLVATTYFSANHFFKPENLAWQEFPYFENVFERTGFLPRTLTGTKYQFKYNFIYYKYSDLISKIAVAFVFVLLISKYKRLVNVYSISIFGFIFLMLFAYPFFDRYLLYALPLSLLFLTEFYKDRIYGKLLIGIFLVYQAYFSYFLVNDFINVHNFVWSKSTELAKNGSAYDMQSSGAWTNTFGRNRVDPTYIFSYDSLRVNPELGLKYQLIEVYKPDFFGNLFINPKVFLYKKSN